MSLDKSEFPHLGGELTLLDFNANKSCSAAVSLWANTFYGDLDEERIGDDDIIGKVDPFILRDYVEQCSTLTSFNASKYTLDETLNWYYDTLNYTGKTLGIKRLHEYEPLSVPVWGPELACRPLFCEHLGWEGDPDLAGIGVYAAFCLQAVLTTIFVVASCWLALSSGRVATNQTDKRPPTTREKVRAALDNCLDVFWSTSFCFALGLMVAAYVIIPTPTSLGSSRMQRAYFASISAQFTTTVLLCIWPWFYKRTDKLRQALVTLVLTVLLMAFLSVQIWYLKLHKSNDDMTMTDKCFSWDEFSITGSVDRMSATLIRRPFIMPPILAGGSLVLFGVMHLADPSRKSKHGSKRLSSSTRFKLHAGAKGAVTILAVAAMWFLFYSFYVMRDYTSQRAGEHSAENEWSFGQVLSLTAWIPTLFELVTVSIRMLTTLAHYSLLYPVVLANLHQPRPSILIIRGEAQ